MSERKPETTAAAMDFLVGILVIAIAIGAAVRMGRAQGVPALPLLAGGLLVAIAMGAIAGGGSYAATKLGRSHAAQLILVLASVGTAIAVGVWLSRIIWRRLQARRRPPTE